MKIDRSKLPRHVAIIMDGNGRWAKKRKLPKIFGHKQGAKTVDRIVEASRKLGIKALTLYSFSTENWKRPKKEIDNLMDLLYGYLDKKCKKLMRNDIRLNAIGRLEKLPLRVKKKLFGVMKRTSGNNSMILTLALNYGARQEITDAASRLAEKSRKKQIKPEDITESIFADELYTKGLPEVDLIIRTSGEMRLSNFLLWQVSYAEIYITDKLWPDFKEKDLEGSILSYQERERRYGG